MSEQPTLGEVMRQVRALVQQVRDLAGDLRNDYVRKDLYDARHHSLVDRVADLERERESDERERRAFQRQVAAGVLVGLVLMVAQIILVLTRIPGGA